MSAAFAEAVITTRPVRSPSRAWRTANRTSCESEDRSLRRAVLARLIAEPRVSAAHIGVAASAGRVTVSGYVTSNAQKDAVRAATRRVKGVMQVTDELWVAVPCPAAVDPAIEGLETWAHDAARPLTWPFNPMDVTQTGPSRRRLRS